MSPSNTTLPAVDSAEEARRAVSYAKYPPLGVRGYAGAPRASHYGRVQGYAHRNHEEICVLVQVETQTALNNIEAIAAVDGVDGIFIGPADLSASLGYIGQPDHPVVRAAIEDAMRRILKAGKVPGDRKSTRLNSSH